MVIRLEVWISGMHQVGMIRYVPFIRHLRLFALFADAALSVVPVPVYLVPTAVPSLLSPLSHSDCAVIRTSIQSLTEYVATPRCECALSSIRAGNDGAEIEWSEKLEKKEAVEGDEKKAKLVQEKLGVACLIDVGEYCCMQTWSYN